MKLVLDISYHQEPKKIDYDLLFQELDGIILRSSYGAGSPSYFPNQPDPVFNQHYTEAIKTGKPVMAYHYITEYQSVDSQLDILKRAIDGKNLVIPVWENGRWVMKPGFWADVELEDGAPRLTRKTVYEFITKAQEFTNVGIYTSRYYWSQIVGNENPYSHLALWVAHYTNAEPSTNIPLMPFGWTFWWLWQYTSSGRLPGYHSSLDLNKCLDSTWNEWIDVGSIEPPQVSIEPLAIEPLSQRDSRWKDEKLGTSSVTIGSYGCLITAVAMVCNYFGKVTDPSKLNKDLIAVNGYANKNLLSWNSLSNIYPDIKILWDYFLFEPNDDDYIEKLILDGIPVIAQVDYYPDTPVLDQHWVLIIGRDDKNWVIIDPINGLIEYLSKYELSLPLRIAAYAKGELLNEPLFAVKVICGALNVRSTPLYMPDGENKVGLLNHGEVVNVYEIADNGWYKIGVDRWISGHSDYTERIEMEPVKPPELTLEEKMDIIWAKLFPNGYPE